jgi:saccharopine dehydrogenase-like NADP-dependent oxidoreductase
MNRVLVLGAGKIGSLITCLLAESGDYEVHLSDRRADEPDHVRQTCGLQRIHVAPLDATNRRMVTDYLRDHPVDAVVSALPYYCNPPVAEIARELGLHYFDLTEDVEVTRKVRAVSAGANKAFVPQCGLAPGFISIAANALMQQFTHIDTVKMRVGALPVNPNNILKYSLTWSTDGLINEYGNFCDAVENGVPVRVLPLEGYETITIDGLLYEGFNTSGGLGTLADTYAGKVRRLNYKTLRYPGHCEKIQLLMNELKLNEDRATLKRILEHAVPKTTQDVVVIYVAVSGYRRGELHEENYVRKIYPRVIADKQWSAIQVTTAAGLCGVLDLVLAQPEKYRGFVTQESVALKDFLANRFGRYYALA